MKVEPEGLFLLRELEPLRVPQFRDLVAGGAPFALKVDYRRLPAPLDELDVVVLVPARVADLAVGRLVLRESDASFEFLRLTRTDIASHPGERVAAVERVNRPGRWIHVGSWGWRVLGRLLVEVPGLAGLHRWWSWASSRLADPLAGPLSLGRPEILSEGVKQKFGHPPEVAYQIKFTPLGLDDSEEALFSRVLPVAGRILVVGCGSGRVAVALAERGFAVTGIDPVPDLVAAARRHAGARGAKTVFETITVEEFGSTEPFDAVVCSHRVYAHTPARQRRIALLRTLATIVAPGGVLIVGAGWHASRGWRRALADVLRAGLRRLLGEHRFPTEPGDRLVRHLTLASDPELACFFHTFRRPAEILGEFAEAGLVAELAPEGEWVVRR